MNPDYRLAPGNLVQIFQNPSGTGNLVGTGDVHLVSEDGATYRVRVLTSTVDHLRVGALVDLPATQVAQQGLRGDTTGGLSVRDGGALLADPRVTQYIGASDRRKLATLDTESSRRHASVEGVMAVTADVLSEIMKNLARAEPALRPDAGEVGTVSWMIIGGDPYAGAVTGGKAKDQKLTVRVFPDQPLDTLPRIDTAELDRRFELALRRRLEAIDEIAEQHLNEPVNQTKGPSYATALRDALVGFARTLQVMLASRPSPDTASMAELKRDNSDVRFALETHLNSVDTRLKNFVGYLYHAGATEKQMWRAVGQYVETLPAQAAVVVLVSSRFSKQGDGMFLLVATRRYAHLTGATTT